MVEEHRLFNASDLLRLNDLAKSENIQVVSKLISSWSDSKGFFGDRGEGLWIARTTESGEVIGVGGITICPTLPGCRRVRRFYIAPHWRRRGVATALANRCIERAKSAGILTVTCHAAASTMAPRFWESIGFEPVEDSDITHVMHLTNQ
ncbi:MAG: GNAT family N-acetyltransferase [Actinobacteria bacterium]|nr:GNAT family N-acetyltransferase [Actinomycetota bacterium]